MISVIPRYVLAVLGSPTMHAGQDHPAAGINVSTAVKKLH